MTKIIVLNHNLTHHMRHVKLLTLGALLCPWSGLHTHAREITSVADETPIFITLGQSNADGYGIANAEEDARLKAWYDSESNPGLMKMWYRSTYLNTNLNSFCWAFEGTTTDVEPGWLNLWYRNENTAGRTAMNMHSLNGTWSNGASTSDAINRRGMEGQFGMRYQQAYPTKELYMIKLGCAGSAIDTWTHTDNHNWEYFYEKMFKPAMEDLLRQGKKPRLAGVWWMQGCKDRANSKEYYVARLTELINNIRTDLGFADAKIYIGHIVKPGENANNPTASVQFGQTVRDAQDAVTTPGNEYYVANTEIIDASDSPFESDNLHWTHVGQNRIGDKIANRVIAEGPEKWASFSMPGRWADLNTNSPKFIPAFGNPQITYTMTTDSVTATITYDGWSETKSAALSTFSGTTVHVKSGATGSGSAWNDAVGTITDAITVAQSNGVNTIAVANGTYSMDGTLTIPNGLTITGGYEGDGSATVFTNTGSGDVVVLQEGTADSYARIARVTVSGATSGRGITAQAYSQIDECIIEKNTTRGNTRKVDDGAGVWLGNNTLLQRSIIRDNLANAYTSGGVSIDGNNVTIKNCLITRNESKAQHGTVKCSTGGILHWAAHNGTRIINTTIVDNTGKNCGAVWCAGNTTISNWYNCILWGNHGDPATNSVEIGLLNGTNAKNAFTNCYVSKNIASFNYLGTDNTAEDGPNFTDPANGDYTLAANSRLIDAGTDTGYGEGLESDLCLAGNNRRQGNSVDVGCYEYSPSSGIDAITVAQPLDASAIYYDLRGQRVNADHLTPGLYIERTANGAARKILITE